MKEEGNVLNILKDTKRFIAEDNIHEIKNLSNKTIHTAAISQDPDNIIVAVLVYAVGKIFEREHYKNMPGWGEFHGAFTKNLDLAISSLQKKDVSKCREALGKIRNDISKIEGDLSRYIRDVFAKAEINKAFKLYEHGISSEQTAQLLGVNLWDMASYIGQSSIGDAKIAISMPIKMRVKIAEEFFG